MWTLQHLFEIAFREDIINCWIFSGGPLLPFAQEFSNYLEWFQSQQWSKGCDAPHINSGILFVRVSALVYMQGKFFITAICVFFFILIISYQNFFHIPIPCWTSYIYIYSPTGHSVPFHVLPWFFLAILLSAFLSNHVLCLFCWIGLLILLFYSNSGISLISCFHLSVRLVIAILCHLLLLPVWLHALSCFGQK